MVTYEQYLKLRLDASPVGLGRGGDSVGYFCTPEGAQILGRAGVDGIHYCTVQDFGETVFAVAPMNQPGCYVHPVARDFTDFLRLVLSCGGTAALEQAHGWDEAQFDAFLRDNPPSAQQQAVLEALREQLSLTPMEQPFSYLKELQAELDYSRIKYAQAPAAPERPEWKVYFDGSFWGGYRRGRAGEEISLNRQLVWDGETWYVPAIYLCGKGLVMDLCMRVPAERIRSFMDKWGLSPESDGAHLTEEQRQEIAAENPLDIHAMPSISLCGTTLSGAHGCGISWNPCFPEHNDAAAEHAIRHYGLDPACGWAIRRASFSWAGKRRPQLKALSVTLVEEATAVPGPHFHVSAPGERVELTHPVSGELHTLTVLEYEQGESSHTHFDGLSYELPTHYIAMRYTLSPDLPEGAFTVADCCRSDQPRQTREGANDQKISTVSFGVVFVSPGSADTISDTGAQLRSRAACAALHFEPVDRVEWRTVFYEKRREDITAELI